MLFFYYKIIKYFFMSNESNLMEEIIRVGKMWRVIWRGCCAHFDMTNKLGLWRIYDDPNIHMSAVLVHSIQ